MGDSTNEKTKKTGFFTRVSAEFKKIIWPDKKSVARQTVAVVLVSVFLGALINILDLIIKFGLNLLTS